MEGTYSVSSGSTELCEMFEEQERRRSIASKQSTFSADTSFQSIGGSLNSWGARRPSSATSYSFGSISGGYPRHASISSVGTSSAGVSSGAGAKTNAGGNQGNSGSGCNPSLGKVGIAEENHSISQRESSQQLRTIETGKQSDGPALSPTSSPASVELIHPGMEIFNPDTGRCPTTERQNPTPPLHSGSLVSPRIPEAKLATSFNPTHSFFITRTGTPGLNKEIADGKSHRMHLLRSRGWEIRDMSGAIKRGSETGGKYQRVGSGGIGGNNQHAEFILETVTEEVFGSWGSWTDAVSHTPWRQSLDSSMLSPTPSTPSLFSHFRSSIPPNSPPLIASTPTSRPSVDTRNGSVSGPFQFPPDPTYQSGKFHIMLIPRVP
ncbi:hypothetical protein BDZ91DRAFT_144743 [Kalaharituber pfeilii]|nr:hypothetical protein BDZ91DRAFT_144743 [Kalaharituber pfeilii]